MSLLVNLTFFSLLGRLFFDLFSIFFLFLFRYVFLIRRATRYSTQYASLFFYTLFILK